MEVDDPSTAHYFLFGNDSSSVIARTEVLGVIELLFVMSISQYMQEEVEYYI